MRLTAIVFAFNERKYSHDFLALLCLPDCSLASFSAFAFFPLAIMFPISVLLSFPSPSLSWSENALSIWCEIEVLTIPAWNRLRSMNLALFWRYLMAIPDPALF